LIEQVVEEAEHGHRRHRVLPGVHHVRLDDARFGEIVFGEG